LEVSYFVLLERNSNSYRIYSFAWIFGFTVTSTTYYIICTYIWPQTDSLIAEAVYPPGKEGHVTPTTPTEGLIVDDKKEILVHEKETDSPV
jgi:NCS1 family nucleobase:cation symporter-1